MADTESKDNQNNPDNPDVTENRFQDFLPSAEYYEAEAQSLELLIEREKRRITRDLYDELKRIEYLLDARERAIALKEIELKQREADLNAREAALTRLEAFEQFTPKKYEEPSEDSLEELFGETEEQEENKLGPKGGSNKPGVSKGYTPNVSGVGGLPGSSRSNAIEIRQDEYQGDKVLLENDNSLRWNKQTKEYEFEFIPSDNPAINANRGLKFTYFAVEAAYLNDGYDNPNYSNFYSQTILRKQIWYEKTPRNRTSDGVGEEYLGKVPLKVLEDMLDRSLNTRLFTSDGKYIEGQSFRRAYKNWRLKYERGTFYKTSKGELYSIIERGSQVSESKGNAPVYRTDGNLRSPTYGQRVGLSTEERRRWRGGM